MFLESKTKGYPIEIDDNDFEKVSSFNWYITKTNKKARTSYVQGRKKGSREMVYLHRLILGLGKGEKRAIDHKNGNGLDNRKENLVCVTRRENQQNFHSHRSGKMVGATARPYGRWESSCWNGGKYIYLGSFGTELEAHNAYMKATI